MNRRRFLEIIGTLLGTAVLAPKKFLVPPTINYYNASLMEWASDIRPWNATRITNKSRKALLAKGWVETDGGLL